MAAGLEPIDIAVFAIGALGALTCLGFVLSQRCPKCRSLEIVDHGRFCRFCGDDLDALTGRFKWVGRVPLLVLPLGAVIAGVCVLLERADCALWSMFVTFAILLARNVVVRLAFGCSGCGTSQLVTRKNLLAQRYCTYCGARV